MRRFGFGLLGAVIGYLLGAFGGGWVISVVSSNQYDRSLEAAMTGAFVLGPLGAVVGLVVALMATPKSSPVRPPQPESR